MQSIGIASAQSKSSSGSFFPPDYAKDPLKGGSARPAEQPLNADNSDDLFGPSAPTPVPSSDLQAGFTTLGDPTPTPTPDPNLEDELTALTEPVTVKQISAIINCDDREHFKAQLMTMRELVIKHDLSVGQLYAVCRSPALNDGIQMPLIIRGGILRVVEDPPAQYPIDLSPTWIVETEKGQHILEGQLDLARAFNSKGEFLTRK